MIDRIEKKKCTGCKMCADLCPNQAISYEVDNKGFWYPVVDYNNCRKCGLCLETCPSLAGYQNDKQNPAVYSAWSRDDTVRLKSTSGGIYHALGSKYIRDGGYIAGCRYTEDYKGAFHGVCNSVSGLEKLMGSKYFQSDTAGMYKEIKGLLHAGKRVLFCGAPCQSAALQNFLRSDHPGHDAVTPDYAGLVTVDFVCKGVSSPKVYSGYLSELEEKYGSEVMSVQMKNKRKGWESLGFCVRFRNGVEYSRKGNEDLWVRGFIENLYLRPCCHDCMYRGLPRVSDLSLGDFWGIGRVGKEEMFKGISLVMVNSVEGGSLFDGIKDDVVCEKRMLMEAMEGNPNITENTPVKGKSGLFFDWMECVGVSLSIKKCIGYRDSGRVWRSLKRQVERIKSIAGFVNLPKFVYYNFISRCIIRENGCWLIPYKNSVIDLHKSARIYIKEGKIELGSGKLKGSKAETCLRMGENSSWNAVGGALLFYNTQIEIQKGARLETGYFSANGGTVIICAKQITIGRNVMLGRNIILYDSDHHQMIDQNGIMINPDEEIIIGDHVWLTSNVTVLRGVDIGEGSVIAAQTVIRKDVPPHSLAAGSSLAKVTPMDPGIGWSRESTHSEYMGRRFPMQGNQDDETIPHAVESR